MVAQPSRGDKAPYADALDAYLAAGWVGVIPLGMPGQRAVKSPVPKGFTGRAAAVPDDAQLEAWRHDYAENNIAIHLPPGIIGIDIDHYGDKHGGDVIDALEAEHGELPASWSCTSRDPESPSGIYLYRTPEVEFISKLTGGVEIIQAKHRYVAAWPSIHPDTGKTYRWYAPDGKASRRPPKPTELPELPPAWVEALTETATARSASRTSPASGKSDAVTARAWLTTYGHSGDRPCRAVRLVERAELGKLEAAAEDGSSRYDTMVSAQMALLHLLGEGHHGVNRALIAVRDAYHDLVRGEAGRDRTEWTRALLDGAGKVSIEHPEPELHDRYCPDVDTDSANPDLWPHISAPHEIAVQYVMRRWD